MTERDGYKPALACLTAFDLGASVSQTTEATLQLDVQKNRVFGSSGCNQYFGTVESSSAREIAIGPLAGTKRMCPPEFMDVETRFLKALGSADSFNYFLGHMAIGYSDGEDSGLLLFSEKAPTKN